MASLPPAAESLGHHANDFMRAGREAEAREAALLCMQMILAASETPGSRPVTVSMAPLAELGVATRSHLRCRCEPHGIALDVPTEIVTPMFTNWMDALVCIRTVLDAPAMQSALGRGVIDVEDASDIGDYPRFAFGSSRPDAVLNVDSYWVKYRGYEEMREAVGQHWVDWSDRADDVLWRGSLTGLRRVQPSEQAAPSPWWFMQRLHLCDVAARSPWRDRLDVAITKLSDFVNEAEAEAIREAGFIKPFYPKLSFLKHRYIIDIDGNANAWNGCFEALLMGATVLKVASPFGWREWYYDRLKPWKHYIPVSADLSDFDEIVTWTINNTAESKVIAHSAREFALGLEYTAELHAAAARLVVMLNEQC